MRIEAGCAYRLRNGSLATITGQCGWSYKDGRTGKPGTYYVWLGSVEGLWGRFSWCLDGKYSPIAGARNELDIVAKADGPVRGDNPKRPPHQVVGGKRKGRKTIAKTKPYGKRPGKKRGRR